LVCGLLSRATDFVYDLSGIFRYCVAAPGDVLVGSLDRFEMWSPDRHQKVQASDAVMAQEAFKLMG
jgi:hypothetical protein